MIKINERKKGKISDKSPTKLFPITKLA